MEIEVKKIQFISNLIFNHLTEDLKISKISLDKDYYWDICKEDIYDMSVDPSHFEAGQLSDDLDFLSKIDSKEDAVSIMFTHLAPILKYIGEKIGH